jgi:ubiquinone/menaquinone biosynthesis C-methylase UbiE
VGQKGAPKRIVEAGYDQVASRYAELEASGAEWPRMRWLREMLSRLPDHSDVLDVGCGNGLPATRAIAKQHGVTGVDISSKQIELARRNVPNARLIQGDAASVEFPDTSFDAIVSFYVLEHLPREEHADVLGRFCRWLRPGGYLLFTVEPQDEPGVVGDWLGAPMFFSQFSADETLKLVKDAGFGVLRHAIEAQREGGRDVPYLWVLAQRQLSAAPHSPR